MNTYTEHELLIKYYDAWSKHDINLVREIFDNSASYEMLGKRTLSGVDQIAQYWLRNAHRQRKLKIFPPVNTIEARGGLTSIFCATFVDIEENDIGC